MDKEIIKKMARTMHAMTTDFLMEDEHSINAETYVNNLGMAANGAGFVYKPKPKLVFFKKDDPNKEETTKFQEVTTDKYGQTVMRHPNRRIYLVQTSSLAEFKPEYPEYAS